MLPDTFQTIAKPCEGLYKDKGSRFISYAYPVKDEDAIREIIAGIRKEHFSARHCCYAWRLGIEQERFRVYDDGEPSGTAGRPILGQIQTFHLTNILIVVIRYFGGTLLGVSGLIQAYKQAAKEAITNAIVISETILCKVEIVFDHLAMNSLMRLIKEEKLEIVCNQYNLQCMIQLNIRLAMLEAIELKIQNIDGVINCNIVQDN